MLELLIVVLIVLWLLGYFGARRMPRIPQTGNLIHVLLVIVLIRKEPGTCQSRTK